MASSTAWRDLRREFSTIPVQRGPGGRLLAERWAWGGDTDWRLRSGPAGAQEQFQRLGSASNALRGHDGLSWKLWLECLKDAGFAVARALNVSVGSATGQTQRTVDAWVIDDVRSASMQFCALHAAGIAPGTILHATTALDGAKRKAARRVDASSQRPPYSSGGTPSSGEHLVASTKLVDVAAVRTGRERVDEFKARVHSETGWKPADVDLVLAAGYQKNSRNLLAHFLKGVARASSVEAFNRVLAMNPKDFKIAAERKRSAN